MDKAIQLQQERMRNRAGPNDVVYDYVYDEPERHATPAQAATLASLAFTERQRLKSIDDDDEARREILREHEKLLTVFSRTHPRVFQMVTEKNRGAEHLAIFHKMARFRQAADDAGATEAEATAAVNEMLQSQCARGSNKE